MKNIYVDGAVKGNAGSKLKSIIGGIGVYSSDYNYKISDFFENATNNKAELNAIYKALTLLEKENIHYPTTIWSDSLYSVNCLTIWYKKWQNNNWKTSTKKDVENKDLIIKCLEKLNKMIFVNIKWIKGHSDNVEHQMADKLAVSTIEQ